MTRHELRKILEISWGERHKQGLQTFEWEHCAKSFQRITNDVAINHFMKMSNDTCKEKEDPTILKCESKFGTYYFGVGLKDCDHITLRNLKNLYNNGNWYIYTWSD